MAERMTTKRLLTMLENARRKHPGADLGLDFSFGKVKLTNASGSTDISQLMSKAQMGDLLFTLIRLDTIKGNPARRTKKNPVVKRRHSLPSTRGRYGKIVRAEFKRFHGKTGGVVGQAATTALSLAKARAEYARRRDVKIEWIPEEERYEDVYGEKPPANTDFYTVVVRIGGEVAASLGFVDDSDREYMRQVENELLAEAFAGELKKNPRRAAKRNPKSRAFLHVEKKTRRPAWRVGVKRANGIHYFPNLFRSESAARRVAQASANAARATYVLRKTRAA